MKRWIFTGLVPLAMFQPSVLAQTNSEAPNVPVSQPISVATSQPALIPLQRSGQIQLQVVNCRSWLDCELARLLLPPSTQNQQRELFFDNPAASTVSVLNSAIVLEGKLTNYQLPSQLISIAPQPNSLPANQISRLILTLDQTKI